MQADRHKPTAILAQFNFEPEAQILELILRDHGIEARTLGGVTSGFRAEAPGFSRVMVFKEDLERAREVLHTVRQDALNIDWTSVDLGEPE